MLANKLSINEVAQGGYTHVFEIGQRNVGTDSTPDLTTTATNTAQDITLVPASALPVGAIIKTAAYWLREPFQDVSDNAFNSTTLSIGTAASTASALAAQQVNVNGTEVNAAATNTPYVATGAAVVARFSSMSAKALADLDRGRVVIALEIVNLRSLAPLAQ